MSFIFFGNTAFAGEYSQTVSSYKSTIGLYTSYPVYNPGNVGISYYMPIGTGLSGMPYSLQLTIAEDQGFAGSLTAYLAEYTSTASTSYTGNYVTFSYIFPASYAKTATTSITKAYGGSWSSTTNLDPTKYYALLFVTNASQIGRIYGTNSGSYGAECAKLLGGLFSCDSSFKAPYYDLVTIDTAGVSRITAITSPANSQITPTQSVNFIYSYFVNTVTETWLSSGVAGIEVNDNTIQSALALDTAREKAITASGNGSYSKTYYLDPAGDSYSWRPYLKGTDASGTVRYIYGDWQLFSVVTPGVLSSPFTINDGNATATLASTTGSGSLFRNWNLLQLKFPLNWVIGTYNIFSGLSSSTATQYVPDASIDYGKDVTVLTKYLPGATSTGNWRITFFGTSTLLAAASVDNWDKLRTLESYILWFGLVGFAWKKTKGLTQIT